MRAYVWSLVCVHFKSSDTDSDTSNTQEFKTDTRYQFFIALVVDWALDLVAAGPGR